jgi:2-oxoglutarate dehydrogenase complex dehydrogenase (E1) component-like enzyme
MSATSAWGPRLHVTLHATRLNPALPERRAQLEPQILVAVGGPDVHVVSDAEYAAHARSPFGSGTAPARFAYRRNGHDGRYSTEGILDHAAVSRRIRQRAVMVGRPRDCAASVIRSS